MVAICDSPRFARSNSTNDSDTSACRSLIQRRSPVCFDGSSGSKLRSQLPVAKADLMKTRETVTISLPSEMIDQIEKVRKAEHCSRSELVREALRAYFSNRFPE